MFYGVFNGKDDEFYCVFNNEDDEVTTTNRTNHK